jgi:hypothetical protein
VTATHTVFAQAFATAFAGITITLRKQFIEIVLVLFKLIALIQHRAIPGKAKSLEITQNLFAGAGDNPWSVNILDT